jgi:DNA-binding NarL/FixJ family response regulator
VPDVAAWGILVADDASSRGWIRAVLEADGRFEICAEASDAAAAIQAAIARPDLCLIGIDIPGGGLAAAREIKARLPRTIVVMFADPDDDGFLPALRAGASGYLLKNMNHARLPHALADAFDDGAPIPRALVARLAAEFRDDGPRHRAVLDEGPPLTSREWQVLELMRQGLSTAAIAERLVVSRVTVRSHARSLMNKLEVPDRESAVRLLIRR